MVAYMRTNDLTKVPARQQALSHDLFHGLTPEEFDEQAKSLAQAEAMTPEVRARLKAHLVERLMTPPDTPTWGPDWVKKGEKVAARPQKGKLASLFSRDNDDEEEDGEEPSSSARALNPTERDESRVIVRNMEKSRQVWHYRWLYIGALALAIVIAGAAMFVDYQIIRGDVWTRALANEFMVVPAALQSTLLFKSLQVIFAVLIVHFMLKITGVYGRNALVATAFVFALVMIGCLGYLVAYNNMAGGTQTTLEHRDDAQPNSAIDKLFASGSQTADAQTATPQVMQASVVPAKGEFALPFPKLSEKSLADADSWFWLAFASVIFFIVTVVAALYLQSAEHNSRNFLIARDYKHRKKQFAQLHLLELADRRTA